MMNLRDFPVIQEIFRIYGETSVIISRIDEEVPILPRFTQAEDLHHFLGKCCLLKLTDELQFQLNQNKVESKQLKELNKFLPSTQHLLDQFHKRYS